MAQYFDKIGATGWFRELLGLPMEAKGLLVSGGSMATKAEPSSSGANALRT